MRSLLNIAFASLVIVLSITSCSQKKTAKNFIPKSAIAVAGINVVGLEKKLLQDSLTVETLIKGLANGNTDTSLKKAFNDYLKVKNSGLDVSEKIYAYIVPSKVKASKLLVVVANVNDRKKFENFITESYKEQFTSSKKDDLTLFKETKLSSGILAVNNTAAIYLRNIENSANDTVSISLEDEIIALFNIDKKDALTDSKHFIELDKMEADGFVYATPSTSLPQIKKFMGLAKVKDLAENLEAGATFNFELGKVVLNTMAWPNDKLGGVLTKYAGPVIDISKVEKFPVKTLNGFLQVNFNPEILVEILSQADILNEARVGGKAALKGIDPLDIQKAFGGQLNVMIGDFVGAPTEGGDGLNSAIDGVTALAEIPVKDKLAFKKIMDTLVAQRKLFVDGNNNYLTPFNADPESTLGISITDSKILLASNKALLTSYQSGVSSALPTSIKAKIENSSTALFADANSILAKAFPINSEKDKIAKDIFGPLLSNIIFILGNFNNGVLKGQFVANLNANNSNALPTILKGLIAYNKSLSLLPKTPTPSLVPLGITKP